MIPAGGCVGRRIRGVLFDFDGTLTLPGALDFPSIKREMGCPQDIPILEYLGTLLPGRRDSLSRILESREVEAAERSLPNAGALVCLSALKRKGLLLGILTRNGMRSVRVALQKFRGVTADDFVAIFTRENALPKPHPDGVYQAAKAMRISTEELMVVGDFRFDVMAGKTAGALTVLLTNHKRPVWDPGDPTPDYTVDRLEDILKFTP